MRAIIVIGVLFLKMFAAKKYLVEVGSEVVNSKDYSGVVWSCLVNLTLSLSLLLHCEQ